MLYICIFGFIIIVIIFALIIPLKINVKFDINTNFEKEKKFENIVLLNHIDLFILGFIKIKRIDINKKRKSNDDSKKENKKNKGMIIFDTLYKLILEYLNVRKTNEAIISKKDLKKINENLYFKKIDMSIGINLQEVILNAYLISFLNTVINMYFAKNIDRINIEDTTYTTYVSNSIINLKMDSIFTLKTIHTIIIILKIIFKFRKVAKENGRTTSNRKFNDDSYDFT